MSDASGAVIGEDGVIEELDETDIIVEDQAEETEPYRPIRVQKEFGRFQLLMEMGHGGMATLYLARIQGPEKFEKMVAIKKIHDHLSRERQFTEMFLDEARISALIHHPNVATIFDLGHIDDSYYIAMEYIHGQNLADLLSSVVRRGERFSWPTAARIVADAAAGLHAAHELCNTDGSALNVVHRDVSPQNILISYDGHVKVVDFGIAFAAGKLVHTAAGTLKGKAAYMSPEQTRGENTDRRSDVFALGILLFECLCLKRLFREENEAATLLRVREAKVPRPSIVRPGIPTSMDHVVLKALAKDLEDRYATAGELGEALEQVLVSEGERVSHLKLGKMMKRFFYETKKIKDRLIQQALLDDSGRTMRAVALGTTDTSLKSPETVTAEKTSPRKALVTALVTAGLFAVSAIVLALVLVLVLGRQDPPKPKQQPTRAVMMRPVVPQMRNATLKPAAPQSPKRPSTVVLKVIVRPSNAPAQVTFRGRTQKGTLFAIKIPYSRKPEMLQVDAKGYQSQVLMMVPTEDNEVVINLRKAPMSSRRRRRRRRRRRKKRKKLLKELPF